MLLPFLLVLAAAAPSKAAAVVQSPTVRVEAAGFLHDARASIDAAGRLQFRARVDGPMTLDRRTFVVESLAADGRVLSTRTVRACVSNGTARRAHTRSASFEMPLGATVGVTALRVRSAD